MKIKTFTGLTLKAFVLAAAAMTAVSCTKKEEQKNGETQEEEVVLAVSAYKISEGNLDNYLEFGGDVASVNAVDVLPDMAGKISRILVNVGDTVKKDQVLAYVDASRPGYNFEASPVKAPISGRLTSFSPTIGTQVAQSMSVAKISNTDDLEIKVNVAERFVSRIQLNQKAILTFDAYPGEEFTAIVSEVSPVLDTTSRTMLTKIKITQKDSKIKVGMYARVKLITDSIKNAILVPATAVVTREGKPYIFKINQSENEEEKPVVKIVPVTLGITVDDKTEITGGLSKDDIIVVKGQSLLNDDSKVKIISLANAD